MPARYTNTELGNIGENLTLEKYVSMGYRLIARNWRYSKVGEIDLILSKQSTLVICEVKTRTSGFPEVPSRAVNKVKRQRIIKLTKIFVLQNSQFRNYNIRFDISQILINKNNIATIDLLENAFYN